MWQALQELLHSAPSLLVLPVPTGSPLGGPSALSLKMDLVSLILLMLWVGMSLCCSQAGDASCLDAKAQCISVMSKPRTQPTEVFPEGLTGREIDQPLSSSQALCRGAALRDLGGSLREGPEVLCKGSAKGSS